MDTAPGLMGKGVDLRQAETGALAHAFRCEERLENARQDVGRDAHACVLHAQSKKLAFELIDLVARSQACVARRDRNRASARHRVARIDCDVYQSQLELSNIDLDRPEIGRHIAYELDIPAQRA